MTLKMTFQPPQRLKVVLLLIAFIAVIDVVSSSCSEKSAQYECPNCGGYKISDCLDCDGYLNTDVRNKVCFKRKLFKDFVWNDIVGCFIWFIAAGIATACGVGGGGIYVPLGIILLQFASKPASGLSQSSIFGASLGGLILNARNLHPDTKIRDTVGKRDEEGKLIPYEKDLSKAEIERDEQSYLASGEKKKFYTKPLIDYDMALFLAPTEMAGAVLGVIIQRLMPNWLFLSFAGVVLGLTSYKTYQKFFAAYKVDKENREKRRLAEEKEEQMANSPPPETAIANTGEKMENGESSPEQDGDVSYGEDIKGDASAISYDVPLYEDDTKEKLDGRRALLEDDARQYPREKILYLILLWIGLTLITFLQGGKGVDSLVGITCKSPWYGVMIAFKFLWTLGFAAYFGYKIVQKHEARLAVNYAFHQNDVLWSYSKTLHFALLTFFAGIIAGLVGIGGGMVLGPLMLMAGVHPRVSSATTATMIVLTSSSVAVMFVTSGLVPWQYAVTFFCICFVGAYLGKKYIDAYVKKTGMSSILIGILATIIALATVGCFVIVILGLNRAGWCFDGFKPFCTVKSKSGGCGNIRQLFGYLKEYQREEM